jgi:hypothetical protein
MSNWSRHSTKITQLLRRALAGDTFALAAIAALGLTAAFLALKKKLGK